MDYNKLVAVSGLTGLFELISSKNDGAIVRSLADQSTKFASSRIHQFSHLESIEIYTVRDNVNLVDIFKAMETDGGTLPPANDDKAVKAYFQKVYSDMDFDRVYVSDMKKMVKWFDILKKNKVDIKLSDPEAVEEESDAPVLEETTESKVKTKAEKPAATEKKGTAKNEEKEKKDEGETEKKAPAKTARPAGEKAAPKKAAAKKKD